MATNRKSYMICQTSPMTLNDLVQFSRLHHSLTLNISVTVRGTDIVSTEY